MKKKRLSLFLFIDAFGWEVLQKNKFFLSDLVVDQKKLATILGYSSACDPSIISGLLPNQHRLWSAFYYDPVGCPYKWVRHLRFLPDSIFRRGRVRHYMSKLIKKVQGFKGYFQVYGVPFDILPLFNYAEQKRIWEPDGLPRGETIFDLMTKKGIPYYVHDSDIGDEGRLEQLKDDIENQRIDFAYCSLGKLDALMHSVGTNDPKVGELMRWYEKKFREIISLGEEKYEEVNWYVFTDHGMHDIKEGYDLEADIEATGLKWNQDYIAFYDSTMARIWFFNDKARSTITAALNDHPKGRIVPDDELEELGVYFSDHMYGDMVFLMNSNIQIVPSFMGVKQIAGMHGYHPADADSYSSISSNRKLPSDLKKIHQIYGLMLEELNISDSKKNNDGGK